MANATDLYIPEVHDTLYLIMDWAAIQGQCNLFFSNLKATEFWS